MDRKIGLLDSDTAFTERLQRAFEEQYENAFSFSLFSTAEQAVLAAEKLNLQLLLVEEAVTLPQPVSCPVLLLSKQRGADYETTGTPYRRICKYKSVSDWYALFCAYLPAEAPSRAEPEGERPDAPACSAEEGARVRSFGTALSAPQDGAEGRPEEATNGTLCLFLSGGGGVGTSTAAAAFALRLAGKKQRVVYLNFEAFSCTDLFFQGESNYDLDDIIFSLRSKKYELQTLLRHALCRDSSGVFFLSPCRSAPDWFSLTGEELIQICHAVGKNMGAPVTLVLDMNADATENFVLPFLYAKRVVLVTNGTEAGNAKTAQLLQALPMLCNLSLFEVEKKVLLLYNRFPVENGKLLTLPELGKLGGIKQTEKGSTPKELIQKLSALSPFQRLEEHLCYG